MQAKSLKIWTEKPKAIEITKTALKYVKAIKEAFFFKYRKNDSKDQED